MGQTPAGSVPPALGPPPPNGTDPCGVSPSGSRAACGVSPSALLLRLDECDELLRLRLRHRAGTDRRAHDALWETLHDLRVWVHDRLEQVGVVRRHRLAGREYDPRPVEPFEGRPNEGRPRQRVATRAAEALEELRACRSGAASAARR